MRRTMVGSLLISPPLDADVRQILERRTPIERHAIARLLATGRSLALLAWIVERPDCDLATASMVFWRLRSVVADEQDDGSPSNETQCRPVLDYILKRIADQGYLKSDLEWDGIEAWTRRALIDAPPLAGIATPAILPVALRGPFGGTAAEPVWLIFLDEDSLWDDVFDSLWTIHPSEVGVADYLLTQDEAVWLAAIDALISTDCDALLGWMLKQRECPSSAMDRISWLLGNDWAGRQALGNVRTARLSHHCRFTDQTTLPSTI